MIDGKDQSNSIIFIIDYILKAVKDRISEHATCRYQYVNLVGFGVTYEDYFQTPHLDILSFKLYSFIIHVPLYINGGLICSCETGHCVNVNGEMIHIPFCSVLVLRIDVLHGGTVGGKVSLDLMLQSWHVLIVWKLID